MRHQSLSTEVQEQQLPLWGQAPGNEGNNKPTQVSHKIHHLPRSKGKLYSKLWILHTTSNLWVSEETKFTMLPVVVLAIAVLLSLNTYKLKGRLMQIVPILFSLAQF